MKRLLYVANIFVKRSDWRMIAVLKACLISLGILAGTVVGRRYKKPVRLVAFTVFLSSYLPLMKIFFSLIKKEKLLTRK